MGKFNVIICMVIICMFPRLQELDPVEILNAAMLVKTGMNNNYSKSHEA